MSAVFNTDLQSKLKQAMSQLQSVSAADSKTVGTSSDSEYINSIFAISQNVQNSADGNNQQKVQTTVNFIEGLLSKISFSQNQQAKANQEVNKNSQAINKNTKAADDKKAEIEQKVQEITTNIGNSTSSIENALAEIEKLGEDGGVIAEYQAQIEAQLQIVEEQKANLNDPEKREEALEAIKNATNEISTIVGLIQNAQATIEAQNAVVEQNVTDITKNIEESATQISEGVADLQKYIQNGSQLGGKASQITAQGGTDVPTGNAEVAAGNAINSNAFSAFGSGGQGVKLVTDGNQRISAGQTRIQGGTKNLQSSISSIGKIGTDIAQVTGYASAIGQIGEGATSLAEQYMSTAQPYIEATGTWDVDAIVEANTQLQADVNSLNRTNSGDEGNNASAQNQEQFLDTKKLRTAFGI